MRCENIGHVLVFDLKIEEWILCKANHNLKKIQLWLNIFFEKPENFKVLYAGTLQQSQFDEMTLE